MLCLCNQMAMNLKVKRGTKEEKYKVEVHKNNEGTFNLQQMEADS